MERPGLLLLQSPDDAQSARRRRADTLAVASSRAGAAAEAYARQKESHLQTA